jgi:hypothetical protein
MTNTASLDSLDDQTTLLILSHLTQELREDIPQEELRAIRSEDEARLAIASFLHTVSEDQLDTAVIVPDNADMKTVGRGLLGLLLEDKDINATTQDLIDHPPEAEQMSVELAIAGVVILGALITWLQTKVKLKVHRRDGRTEFEIEINKDVTDASTLKEMAKAIVSLLTLP